MQSHNKQKYTSDNQKETKWLLIIDSLTFLLLCHFPVLPFLPQQLKWRLRHWFYDCDIFLHEQGTGFICCKNKLVGPEWALNCINIGVWPNTVAVSPFSEMCFAIRIQCIGHVVVLIHLLTKTKTPGCWSLSFSTMCETEVGYLTSAASGNVTSTHFSHSSRRSEGLSGCRPRERDVRLFPASENGSPPFLLDSCHIDSTDRQDDLTDTLWVLYDFFILTEQTELDRFMCLMQQHILVLESSGRFYGFVWLWA